MDDEPDWAAVKGIADEKHWVEFIPRVGGELVAPHIKRQGVKNADFMFPYSRVVLELKVVVTELAHSEQMLAKVDAAFAQFPGGLSDPYLQRELFSILRVPLKRILKTANRQIRETKQELGLVGWRGLIVLVNDGFRGIPPDLAIGLVGDIMASESYSSCDGLIYQTNHLVELRDNPYANWLWIPMYNPRKSDDFVEFVNHIGREWRAFHEEIGGPIEYSAEHETMDLSNSYVVKGPTRHERYVGPAEVANEQSPCGR
ncbi:hypothetical protein FHS96_005124 [Sphingomonas zeicaulis]|uniref:hypothetical protein n=1 Tax=Sphingomonas zeicaulis TaxID=1632740 RepID=UPI003D1B1AB9